MGVIITMDSEKFLKKFLPATDNTDGYQFILISEDIKIRDLEGKKKNIMSFPTLIPTPPVINLYVNGETKSYKKAYLNQLQEPEVEAFITVLVKAAVINDFKVVLLCSTSEAERGYIELLSEYIEAAYQLKTYSWKKFNEDQEKACKIKNKDEIVKILGRKFEKMERLGVSLNLGVDTDKIKKKLGKLGKKELRKLAKTGKIKVDKEMDKKTLIKKILKKASA
jgi:hypothetical protein